MSNRNNDDPLQPPVMTTESPATTSPVSMRARNNIFPSPQPSYGNISYMKQRAYRANAGTGAPAYSNIHHKRYPSIKGLNQNQVKHQPTSSSSKHQVNHSGKNISPLVNSSLSSVLGSSVSSPSGMKLNSPSDIIQLRERSFSTNSNYSITSNNSPRPHNLSADSSLPSHVLLTPKQDHDGGSNKSSPLKFSDLDVDKYSPHSRNKANNIPLFTNSPSPQRKLYESPSIYGPNPEKPELKKLIMRGLALQIPGVPSDQQNNFTINNLRRGVTSNLSPSLGFRQNVVPDPNHNESNLKRESNSSSEDELFNDVVEDEEDEDEEDLNPKNLGNRMLEDKLEHSSLSSMAQTVENNSIRSGSLMENDTGKPINDCENQGVLKHKEKHTKQEVKEFDDSFYKVQNKQSQGFLSPTFDEEDNPKLDHISVADIASSNSNPFGPVSAEVISPNDVPETPINKIPASKADAELQNAIKSLLSIKRTPTGNISKSSTPLSATLAAGKIKDSSTGVELSLMKSDVTQKLPETKLNNDSNNNNFSNISNNSTLENGKPTQLIHNGKSDLYLDRFPSFSLSSDLISPPISPAEAKMSGIHDQLANNIKGTMRKVSSTEKNNITDNTHSSLNDDDNISVVSKKSYFDIMKNSISLINWDVNDPMAWTMDRVVLWLKMYNFNDTWVDIFVKYKMCHDKFLELINDESFSKFNTYLKLNNDYLDVATSDKDSKKGEISPHTDSNRNNNDAESVDFDNNNKFLSSSSKFRYLLKKTIQNEPESAMFSLSGRVMDDLDIVSKTRPNLIHRHSRSSSDDANSVLNKIMNKDKTTKTGFNIPDSGNFIYQTVNSPPITSPSIISPEYPQSKSNKRLSYIKKPFMSMDKSKNSNIGDSSLSSSYLSIFKKHVNPLSPSSRLSFDDNDTESIENNENKEKRASTFLKKKLRKMDKLTLSTSAGRKSMEGSSPISPGTISSFESNKKELVGHLQLTDKQIPKPFHKKSKNYILVTKDNILFVAVAAQDLLNINSFKLSIANALNLQTEDIAKLNFHLTDYESEYGEALNDSTLEDLISFDFIKYELKFFVYSEIQNISDLAYSHTVLTRSTKSSDNNSFELAADNKIAYPNTPSYLISDNKKPSEEVDYLNFKDNKGFLTIEKEVPQKKSISQKSSFSVIRPDANKNEINFDKKRESPFVTVKPNLIPQRPAPLAPPTSLHKTSAITKKNNTKPNDNNKNSIMLSASELKRTNSLLRNNVARQSSIRNSRKFSTRNSMETFKENEISFDGVPTLAEDDSEEEEDSDDDFWAVAPKTTNPPLPVETEDSDAPGSVTGTPEQVMKTLPERFDRAERLTAINTTDLVSEKRKRNFSSPVFRANFKGKAGNGNWEFRPSDVTLIDNLEQFFPNTDLDKPIIYEVDTPPASPGVLPPMNEDNFNIPVAKEISGEDILMFKDSDRRISRNSRRKTIRGIARESSIARSRLSQVAQATNNNALLRRRSTKFWGRKTVELTPADLKYDRISELRNNKGETKQIKWIKGDLIGTGSYGRVYLAINLINGEMMAVKQVVKPRSGKVNEDMQNVINALLEEMQFMKDLDHPNITQYLGFEDVGDTYSLFLEYVAGGSVASCLSNYGRFDDKLIRYLTRQITDGLAYLHSEGILHRDLKAANLLLDLDGICKISDFGISKRSSNVYKNDAAMSMQGTIFWMAPEVVNNSEDSGYSAKVDIWSLGCVVLEMFAGKRPWSNFEFVTALMKIGTYAAPPIDNETKKYISDDGNEFLNHCFKVKPVERPTALELFENNKFCKPMSDFSFRDTELSKMMLRKL